MPRRYNVRAIAANLTRAGFKCARCGALHLARLSLAWPAWLLKVPP